MGVNSLPKTVTRQRHGCELNPGLTAPESSTLITRLLNIPTKACSQWRRQKEEVGWALASVRQPNAEGVRSEAPRVEAP